LEIGVIGVKQFYVIEVISSGSKRVNESLVLDSIDVKSKIIAPYATENPIHLFDF